MGCKHVYVRMYICVSHIYQLHTYVCCSLHIVVYSVELTVKILALGPHSFFTKAWNVWVLLDTLMYVHCRRLECVHTKSGTPVAVAEVFWHALTHTRSTKCASLASWELFVHIMYVRIRYCRTYMSFVNAPCTRIFIIFHESLKVW